MTPAAQIAMAGRGAGARRQSLENLLAKGLEHCRRAGLTPVVVAFPDAVAGELLESLSTHGAVEGVVVLPAQLPVAGWEQRRVGVMRRDDYTWELPAVPARTVLYVGPRRTFTFRMARRALAAGIRCYVHTTPISWKTESIPYFVCRRVMEKMLHVVTRSLQGGLQSIARVKFRSRPLSVSLPALFVSVRVWCSRNARYLSRPWERLGFSFTRQARLRELLSAPGTPLLAPNSFVPQRVVHYNSALAWGGAERQLVNTLLGAKRQGSMEVSLVCEQVGCVADHDFYLDHLQEAGIEVGEISRDPQISDDPEETAALERIAERLDRLPRGLADDILFIVRDLLTRRPSVVHAWQDSTSIKAGLAAALVGVPRIVLSTRNLAPFRFPYWMPYMWASYRALLERENVVLVNNSKAGARDYARWIGTGEERIGVVLNGFSPARFKRSSRAQVAAYRREIGIPDGVRLVGSIFRFYPEKDPLLWMRAASLLARERDDVAFLVLGTGPLKDKMLEKMAGFGLEGRMWLPGTDKNVARMLSALDVFMLTSKMEGTPNVLIEAQMLGVPVVCTDAGGSAECVEDGVTGWVVRNRSVTLLARRVSEVLGDDVWRERAVVRAPRFAGERFAIQRMLTETFRLYESTPQRPAVQPFLASASGDRV